VYFIGVAIGCLILGMMWMAKHSAMQAESPAAGDSPAAPQNAPGGR
jgi:hypothetical protein